jgi:TonB-linked SusC/RagA family outer membrane protein
MAPAAAPAILLYTSLKKSRRAHDTADLLAGSGFLVTRYTPFQTRSITRRRSMMRSQNCARSLPGLVLAAGLLAFGFSPGAAQNTGAIQGRVVEAGTQRPLAGAQVTLVGTTRTMLTNPSGEFLLPGVPAGAHRVRAEFLGYTTGEATTRVAAGQTSRVELSLSTSAISLDAVIVTALGQTATRRELGTSQQTVRGTEIAETQRENFVNALQGRIAGVEVTSTSGVPGASSSITIRGVSSISGSNQPLIIVDGLPMDNKTLSTHDWQNNQAGFENRGVDFANRGSDLNSEDIESITVLKGPEAAALYGIDAGNGAIVIRTKRGQAGTAGFEYSNSIRVESLRGRPEIQQVYGPSTQGSQTFLYYGTPYPEGTRFYDNISSFFEPSLSQRHNLTFSGATQDAGLNYRISASALQQKGVIPTSALDRINVSGAGGARVTNWLHADLTLAYMTDENNQPWKGAGGPLIGLLVWPDTIDATDYLTPQGNRRRLTTLSAAAEIDNPFFSVYNNFNRNKTNRLTTNLGITLLPFSFGTLKTNIGSDYYTTRAMLHRHPESALGISNNGILDLPTRISRIINVQTVFNMNRRALASGVSVAGLIGNSILDDDSDSHSLHGRDFLYADFISINNTNLRTNRTTLTRRRLVGLYGQATFDYNNYLYVTVSGRNDWTSTIPVERNSFFYPGVNASFVFSDAFPSVGQFVTGKVTAAWARAGKDASPYAYRQALEFKPTSYGGFGYGFWGPNPNLRPEFKTSYELGTELGFLENRLGLNLAFYRAETTDQIVNNIRASYGTGFILVNLNGGITRNEGWEATLRGTPLQTRNTTWDVITNFTRARGTVISLPEDLPEAYNSDTWLYGNVRNGTRAGQSIMSMTGLWYLRNDNGELLISPTSGLPIRDNQFTAKYDRQPDFLIGITNAFRHRRLSASFLVDIRKGGDVFNATQHYLTARGLTPMTLDRETPRIIPGVLRDGKENTDNPTRNNIVIVPAVQTGYYTGMSEELFIEEDINWLRLRDVTLRYQLPNGLIGTRSASVFVTGTDLYLLTNYSGLDPIVNGNTAAVGGSGGIGVDFGNFPMPRGFNFGIRMAF